MGKGCSHDNCQGDHHAKGFCKTHYRMPSQINPKPLQRSKPISRSRTTKTKTKTKSEETLPELIERTQKVFNAAIRKRDLLPDNTFVCISCGLFKRKSEMDAGHYYGVRYSAIRFNEDNVHGECITCNRHDSRHLIRYRPRLIEKIGLDRMNQLDDMRHKPVKWDRQELLTIIEKYK